MFSQFGSLHPNLSAEDFYGILETEERKVKFMWKENLEIPPGKKRKTMKMWLNSPSWIQIELLLTHYSKLKCQNPVAILDKRKQISFHYQ